MSVAQFPTPATIGVDRYNYYEKVVQDWSEVTQESLFEDAGVDFNLSAPAPPQRWIVKLGGLSEAEFKVLNDHWTLAKGRALDFSFQEPRDFPWTGAAGTLQTGVRYESFEHTRPTQKYYSHTVEIVLIKRPA